MSNETEKSSDRDLLIQKLQEHVDALRKEDIWWLEQSFSDTYIFINPSGTVATKSETIALLKSGAIKLQAVDVDDEIANFYGEAAVVSAVSTVNCFINEIDISG